MKTRYEIRYRIIFAIVYLMISTALGVWIYYYDPDSICSHKDIQLIYSTSIFAPNLILFLRIFISGPINVFIRIPAVIILSTEFSIVIYSAISQMLMPAPAGFIGLVSDINFSIGPLIVYAALASLATIITLLLYFLIYRLLMRFSVL